MAHKINPVIHGDINHNKARHSRESGNPERHWIPCQACLPDRQARNDKLHKTYVVMYNGVKNIKGITLIELLIVIAIIGIVSGLAAIATDWFLRESRLTESRDRLVADLEFIKLQSVTKAPHAVFFFAPAAPALHRYELHELNDGRCSTATTTECNRNVDCPVGETCVSGDFRKTTGESDAPLSLAEAKGYNCDIDGDTTNDAFCLPTDYKITWTNCGGGASDELWFDRKGIPRCDTWSLGMGTIRLYRDENGDNTFQATELNKTIIIDSVGRLQYEQ